MTMPKRRFGKTGLEVSPLGFGCMRLPLTSEAKTDIDIPLATAMLRKAVDAGVNYVDTAWPYHTETFPEPGKSEPFLAHALKDGYREKVILATKLPVWVIEKADDMDRFLDEQLRRLDTGRLDVYLVHNLNGRTWGKMRDLGVLPFLDRVVKDGRVGHVGFSFHDNLDLFREIMGSYDWPIVQIQLNYLDTAYQAGLEGLDLAAEKDAAVVVMEPLRGGFLINNIPDALKGMLREIRPEWSLADWGFRWLYANPKVGTVLSGMSAMDQVEENVRIASNPGEFGPDEYEALEKVRAWFVERMPVNCTACSYCLPCPNGIPIPNVFAYYNEYHLDDHPDVHARAKMIYGVTVPEGHRAEDCVACGVCEERCPQNIPISEKMKLAAAIFAE